MEVSGAAKLRRRQQHHLCLQVHLCILCWQNLVLLQSGGSLSLKSSYNNFKQVRNSVCMSLCMVSSSNNKPQLRMMKVVLQAEVTVHLIWHCHQGTI
jgi:hypothetical protein